MAFINTLGIKQIPFELLPINPLFEDLSIICNDGDVIIEPIITQEETDQLNRHTATWTQLDTTTGDPSVPGDDEYVTITQDNVNILKITYNPIEFSSTKFYDRRFRVVIDAGDDIEQTHFIYVYSKPTDRLYPNHTTQTSSIIPGTTRMFQPVGYSGYTYPYNETLTYAYALRGEESQTQSPGGGENLTLLWEMVAVRSDYAGNITESKGPGETVWTVESIKHGADETGHHRPVTFGRSYRVTHVIRKPNVDESVEYQQGLEHLFYFLTSQPFYVDPAFDTSISGIEAADSIANTIAAGSSNSGASASNMTYNILIAGSLDVGGDTFSANSVGQGSINSSTVTNVTYNILIAGSLDVGGDTFTGNVVTQPGYAAPTITNLTYDITQGGQV
jgi:hypothetical protein